LTIRVELTTLSVRRLISDLYKHRWLKISFILVKT